MLVSQDGMTKHLGLLPSKRMLQKASVFAGGSKWTAQLGGESWGFTTWRYQKFARSGSSTWG